LKLWTAFGLIVLIVITHGKRLTHNLPIRWVKFVLISRCGGFVTNALGIVGGHVGVAPKVFQFVEGAGFRVKDVDYYVEVVKADPVCMPTTGGGFRQVANFLLQTFLNVVGDGGNLGGRFTFADEEKVCRPIVQFAQVEADNIFAFDVPDAIQDELQSFFRFCGEFGGGGGYGSIQNRLF
jgi:hypothetical protein